MKHQQYDAHVHHSDFDRSTCLVILEWFLLEFVHFFYQSQYDTKHNQKYIRWSFSISYFERYLNVKIDYLELLLSVYIIVYEWNHTVNGQIFVVILISLLRGRHLFSRKKTTIIILHVWQYTGVYTSRFIDTLRTFTRSTILRSMYPSRTINIILFTLVCTVLKDGYNLLVLWIVLYQLHLGYH